MTEAFICETVRTPRAKASPRGGLHDHTPTDLLVHLHRAIQRRTDLDVDAVDDVIIGAATQIGEQGANIAKTSAILAGWGDSVAGLTVNRFCASGIEAVNLGASRIKSGDADVVLAGGVESVSRVPMFSDEGPLWADPATIDAVGAVHMGISGDVVATQEGFEREQLDAYGVATQQKAAAAWAEGRFDRSLEPIARADGTMFATDEQVRADASAASLAAMDPSFIELGASGQDELAMRYLDGLDEIRHLHTRGTSPSLADGAALLVLASEEAIERYGLVPRARIVTGRVASVDPVTMLTAGQLAVEQAIERAGLVADDIDVFEFAEAFAALCLRFQRDLDVDHERFNPNGGTIAMGHAFGATGAIMAMGVVDELERRDQQRGVAAVSGAAGLGVATVIERV